MHMSQTISLKQSEYGSESWWLKTIQQGEEAIQKRETISVQSDENIDTIFSI